jgi:hypothetical protein
MQDGLALEDPPIPPPRKGEGSLREPTRNPHVARDLRRRAAAVVETPEHQSELSANDDPTGTHHLALKSGIIGLPLILRIASTLAGSRYLPAVPR